MRQTLILALLLAGCASQQAQTATARLKDGFQRFHYGVCLESPPPEQFVDACGKANADLLGTEWTVEDSLQAHQGWARQSLAKAWGLVQPYAAPVGKYVWDLALAWVKQRTGGAS